MTSSSNTNNERRSHERVSDPVIRLKIEAKVYTSETWSLGGALVEDYDGELSTGSLLTISEIGLSRGVMTPVNIRARVIRSDSSAGHLALQMLELDQPGYAILQKLLAKKMQLLRS